MNSKIDSEKEETSPLSVFKEENKGNHEEYSHSYENEFDHKEARIRRIVDKIMALYNED